MPFKYSEEIRNGQLDAIKMTAGSDLVLQLRTDAPPRDCTSPDVGEVIVEMAVTGDWMRDARDGWAINSTEWSGIAVISAIPGHFRLKDRTTGKTHLQGSAGQAGADMEFSDEPIESGMTVHIGRFELMAGNE